MTQRPLLRLVQILAAAAPLAAASVLPAAALAAPPAATVAQADTGGPRWNELNPAQRRVLAPLAKDWDTIDGRGKDRWLGVAGRFPNMPAEEQARANQRMVEWSRMTPSQRTEARINFQDTRNVSKEEREARWKAYQALPDDQKRELAGKRAAATAPASAASNSIATSRRHPPVEVVQPKTNVVDAIPAQRTPVEPGSTVMRTNPGATTTLLTRRSNPPAHQQEGQPKIAVGGGNVDRKTLLPKKGPQAPQNGNGKDNGPNGPQRR